jgi:hypothetical protein
VLDAALRLLEDCSFQPPVLVDYHQRTDCG